MGLKHGDIIPGFPVRTISPRKRVNKNTTKYEVLDWEKNGGEGEPRAVHNDFSRLARYIFHISSTAVALSKKTQTYTRTVSHALKNTAMLTHTLSLFLS